VVVGGVRGCWLLSWTVYGWGGRSAAGVGLGAAIGGDWLEVSLLGCRVLGSAGRCGGGLTPGTAIPRMLAPQFTQNFLQLFFENHTQIQCFDVKITINK